MITQSSKVFFAVFFTLSLLNTTARGEQALTVQNLDVVEQAADLPMGQSGSDSVSLLPEDSGGSWLEDDLFGTQGGGYLHAFLSISGEYTDNLFNVNTNEKDNFLTAISPGLWLALPSRKEVPLTIAPNNTSPGGLQLALDEYTTFDRMNLYLLGGITYKTYSEDSTLNDYDGRLEGLFRYNMRGGLSLGVIERFTRSQDRFDIANNIAEDLRKFTSNLAMGDIDWEITEKVRTKLEYSNFLLNYKDRDDEWLNRTDNSLSLFAYYNYSVKTSFFVEYRFIDVAYDIRESKDSEYNYFFGGINWTTTEKTAFRTKLGYQKRKYKNDLVQASVASYDKDTSDAFTFELALDYYFSEKTKFLFAINNEIEETDSYDSLDKTVLGGNLHYEQDYTRKITGVCDLRYENADYNQINDPQRKDDYFLIRPALRYTFKDWLMAELSYSYSTRSSTIDYYDYTTNTISISLNSAL